MRTQTEKSAIVFDGFRANEFQKEGTKTAQIRQKVVTHSYYPSKQVANNLSANLFAPEEFGFKEQHFESTEERVCWMLVPKDLSEEAFKQRLAKANTEGATLYKVLSSSPILDNNQHYAINQGLRTKDQFANSQAVRYPENEETLAKGTANKLVLDKAGLVQYRRINFWPTAIEDQDVRGEVIYVSKEIEAELKGASVLEGQTL